MEDKCVNLHAALNEDKETRLPTQDMLRSRARYGPGPLIFPGPKQQCLTLDKPIQIIYQPLITQTKTGVKGQVYLFPFFNWR